MKNAKAERVGYDQKMQEMQSAAGRILVPADRKDAVRCAAVGQGSRAVQ